MIRIKDAQKSLKFYQEVLGMSLMRTHEASGFNLYFLGYPGSQGVPAEGGSTPEREGLLELTWNHGTEKDESFSYHNGNAADRDGRQGFGHICKFTVPLPVSFFPFFSSFVCCFFISTPSLFFFNS